MVFSREVILRTVVSRLNNSTAGALIVTCTTRLLSTLPMVSESHVSGEGAIATLHLICGLPCSGKTTRAKQIEHERAALRLTPDEWIIRLFGLDLSLEALDAARDPVETALWDLAARLLVLGVDVILDFGFWSRSERDEFRARARQLGARSEVHFLEVPEEQLLVRLAERNSQLPPGTFWIDEARLRLWSSLFEPPTPDELRPWD